MVCASPRRRCSTSLSVACLMATKRWAPVGDRRRRPAQPLVNASAQRNFQLCDARLKGADQACSWSVALSTAQMSEGLGLAAPQW